MKKNAILFFIALALVLFAPGGYVTASDARHPPEDTQVRGDGYYTVRPAVLL